MYLITNTSLRDSLYVDGVRIASQQTKSFKELKPLTLAILKRTANARIQLTSTKIADEQKKSDKSNSNIDSTTVSTLPKQKPAKKTLEVNKPAEPDKIEDNVVEDKQD